MGSLDGSEYVALLRELSEIGSHEHVDTPSIVVCGDQSAGKSSLIQRVCGIPLPRSDGTCTRCPMEVALIPDGAWSCTVKIRKEYSESGEKLGRFDEQRFGEVITDESSVELAIKRAQKAVLNPGKPADDFLQYDFSAAESGQNHDQTCFTKNVIVLEVRGAPYSLTLIDLPCIINTTEKEENAQMINLIKDLVLDYIRKPRTIIVAAISCKNDIENQGVHQMIKSVPGALQKTMGVLTKPDQIEEGCYEGWLAVMKGSKFGDLKLGYFMVRNLNKAELDKGTTLEESYRIESDYFQEEHALRELRESRTFSSRLGVSNLVKELSSLLISMVKEQLPGMRKAVEEKLKTVRDELTSLPVAVDDRNRAEVLQRTLRNLSHDVRQLIHTQSNQTSCKQFAQSRMELLKSFARSVASTRPLFMLKEKPEKNDAAKEIPKNMVASYGEDDVVSTGESPASVLTIADVTDIMAKQRTCELPSFMPYSALEEVIRRFQGMWDAHAFHCLEESTKMLRGELRHLVSMHFGPFAESQLESRIMSCMEDLVDMQQAETRRDIDKLIKMEACCDNPPFTANLHYFEDSLNKIFEDMKVKLHEHKTENIPEAQVSAAVSTALSALAIVPGCQGLSKKELLGRLCTTGKEEELKIIAATMAYYKVSSKRFIDYVGMTVLTVLHKQVAAQLEDHIDGYLKRLAAGHEDTAFEARGLKEAKLGDGKAALSRPWQDSEAVLSLVTYAKDITHQRSQLEAKLESLQSIRRVLSRYA